jgi:hypothetical protein
MVAQRLYYLQDVAQSVAARHQTAGFDPKGRID